MSVTTDNQDETDSTVERSQQHELCSGKAPSNSMLSVKRQLVPVRRSHENSQAGDEDAQSRRTEIDAVSDKLRGGSLLGVYGQRETCQGPEHCCLMGIWLRPHHGIPHKQIKEYNCGVAHGGGMVSHGTITIGELNSFLMYTVYAGSSLFGLSSFYSELMKGVGAASRLFELQDREPTISPTAGKPVAFARGPIRFGNVSFSYPTWPAVSIFRKSPLLDFPKSPPSLRLPAPPPLQPEPASWTSIANNHEVLLNICKYRNFPLRSECSHQMTDMVPIYPLARLPSVVSSLCPCSSNKKLRINATNCPCFMRSCRSPTPAS